MEEEPKYNYQKLRDSWEKETKEGLIDTVERPSSPDDKGSHRAENQEYECDKCKTDVSFDDRFCPNCGTDVSEVEDSMNVEFPELYSKYLEIYWDGDINNALKLDYDAREAHQKALEYDIDTPQNFYSFATERSMGFAGKVYEIFHFKDDGSRTVKLENVFIVDEGTNVLRFEFEGKVDYPAGAQIPCEVGGTYSFYGRIGYARLEWDLFYAGTVGGALHSGLRERVPFLALTINLKDASCVRSSETEYSGRSFGLSGGERFLWRKSASDRELLDRPIYRDGGTVRAQAHQSTGVVSGATSGAAKGGCFIATAAYGSPLAAEVVLLSRYRDEVMLSSKLGTLFVKAYYRASPPLAVLITRAEVLRIVTRGLLIAPLVKLLKFSNFK